jgi:hypothetical protein
MEPDQEAAPMSGGAEHEERRQERIGWIVYASPAQVLGRLRLAATDAGIEAQIAAGFVQRRMRISLNAPPPESVPTGSFDGSVVRLIDGWYLKVALVEIDNLPGEISELRMRHGEAPTDSNALERYEANATELAERWDALLASLHSRLQTVGIDYDDALVPGFTGPHRQELGAVAIAKPSERSMWVDPVFFSREFRRRDDLCFVLMPFLPELQGFYEHVVKRTVEECGFTCERADNFAAGQTDIVDDIWVAINEARFLIVDLTGQNANVYYELGIANALGKRVIAIHKQPSDGTAVSLPFDVRTRRATFYEDSASGIVAFTAELRRNIESILQSRA